MNGCMGTDKPLVSILMAVYEPRMDWLREQLESLEAQTYPNLRLYIRDDCSPTVPFGEVESLVRECIWSFPYEMRRNENNLGSNLTFERLTQEAEGAYFAYCDQDDIWLPKKVAVLQEQLEDSGALLACSDMYIIDRDGKRVADSITKIRRRHRFHSGSGLAEGLLISNFVTGCTMLVQSSAAKAAVPFCPYMVHDHYIALCCASAGAVISLPSPLIQYRVHGRNQTELMAGVTDKNSYERVRIDQPLKKFQWLSERFPYKEELAQAIQIRTMWMEARKRNWNGGKDKRFIWKYRGFSPPSTLFEVIMRWLPEPAFRLAIWLSRKNVI
ncbi:MAG: glycosyltransferase [Oscillospiraceae bacterium]|nr:glycosyltransferase [Oscillospiraceae bacterium]